MKGFCNPSPNPNPNPLVEISHNTVSGLTSKLSYRHSSSLDFSMSKVVKVRVMEDPSGAIIRYLHSLLLGYGSG